MLTKLDGDSRGGAALSVRQVTGVPIKFAGVSEKIDGLEVFDAERHAGRILGMGDIVALVEQVTAGVDVAAAQKLAAKVKSGAGFDLNDFLGQLQQMKQMGGLSSLINKPARADGRQGQRGRPQPRRARHPPQGRHHQQHDAAGAPQRPNCSRPRASAASPPAPACTCRK